MGTPQLVGDVQVVVEIRDTIWPEEVEKFPTADSEKSRGASWTERRSRIQLSRKAIKLAPTPLLDPDF
jgi:hypothetical protein